MRLLYLACLASLCLLVSLSLSLARLLVYPTCSMHACVAVGTGSMTKKSGSPLPKKIVPYLRSYRIPVGKEN